ncbi:MAG: Eco57I restriction-modification methylase domain-containing protein [Selenomonadaceae bacterium]|nr:Eco57I restriction-modification methylase domain-containing protein [Selenomonadaceae bacterium]
MIDFNAPPLKDVLKILLRGVKISDPTNIKPRAQKSAAEKFFRTRSIAEVFTPSRAVKFMVDALDDGRIDSTWLEIACGEAPFITNRYDAETGEIIPPEYRVGILDRKLRAAKNFPEAKRALQSVYGYERQADSLLIARANVLLTFAEAVENFSDSNLAEAAEIISHNFWRMDALNPPPAPSFVKFDYVISNPPYQDDPSGGNKTFAPPIYHHFMEAARKISDKAVFITPARFLFDAGATPQNFNRRMLNDPHFKVLDYAPDAKKYFRSVEIKGGVAITRRDDTKNFGAIKTFIPFPELESIHKKVCVDDKNFRPFSKIIYPRAAYRFAENNSSVGTNAFDKMGKIFFDAKPADDEYLKVLGRVGTQRIYKWIRRNYIRDIENLGKYKVFIPSSSGSGEFGEVLSEPLVGEPFVIATETFTAVGAFDTRAEAAACLAYIKSKFARALLGILKVTQHNPPPTWAKVPLQDFTAESDIDWSGNVDAQLYRKYKLNALEIKFIERHLKTME